jgi:tyrosyl-tRNA synthetase
VVRRKEAPAEIESVALPEVVKDGAIRVDKLLARIGLAESVSDAARKIKAGAVEINGAKVDGAGLDGHLVRNAHSGGQELAKGHPAKPPCENSTSWKLKRREISWATAPC